VQLENKIWFRTICTKNEFVITDLQIEQLDQYVNLLLDWNKKINLISRKDEENFWTYHILHSISPLFKLNIPEESRLVDIGTGGGLPGIPLKILRPDLALLCIDATRKKADAVTHMAAELKLKEVNIIWGRAEEVGLQAGFLNTFDFTIARAVCRLNELIALSKNFLRKNSRSPLLSIPIDRKGRQDAEPPAIIAFKGGDLTQEIDQAKRQYPSADIHSIGLTFAGSEQLIASDKKLLIVHL